MIRPLLKNVKNKIYHRFFLEKELALQQAIKDREELILACQKKDNELDRLYRGCSSLTNETNLLKYRIRNLSELIVANAIEAWDGSPYDKFVCTQPFQRIEILERGEIFNCCSAYLMQDYYFGNIYADDFMTVWNSNKEKQLRYAVTNGNFEFCNRSCKWLSAIKESSGNFLEKYKRYYDVPIMLRTQENKYKSWQDCYVDSPPKIIALTCDSSCNLHCPSCRKEIRALNKTESAKVYKMLMDKVYPLLDGCKLLNVLGSGEFFASEAVQRFVKNIDKESFPDMAIFFRINGQLFNEIKWNEFDNIHGRKLYFAVSVDAASKKTYEKIRLGGKWETLIENLSFIKKLRESNEIAFFQLNFVIQKDNFNELPKLYEWSKSLSVDAIELTRIDNWGTFSQEEFADIDILDEKHPDSKKAWCIVNDILHRNELIIIDNLNR